MANVLLIEPNTKYSFDKRWVRTHLGLLYLASSLEMKKNYVKFLPQPLLNFNLEYLQKFIRKYRIDLIGISSLTANYNETIKIVNHLHNNFKHLKFVLGGCHPTYYTENILKKFPFISCVVRKEGEITFPKVISAIESNKSLKNIDGIAYIKGKEIIVNKDSILHENLDNIPLPARHIIPMYIYKRINPEAHILCSRGCFGNCTFCTIPDFFGKKIRFRSVENIIYEIELILKKYKFNRIKFEDCVFTFNKQHLFLLCDEIIRRNLKFSWRIQTRLDKIDREIITRIAKAGCREILIGIESVTDRIANKLYHKKINLNCFKDILKFAEEKKINIFPSFIVGAPDESFEEAMKTINFAKGIYIKLNRNPRISYLTPFPGTMFFEKYLKDKHDNIEIEGNDFDKFSQHIPILKTSKMNIKELARLWAISCRDIVFSDCNKLNYYLKENNCNRYISPKIFIYKFKEFEIKKNKEKI